MAKYIIEFEDEPYMREDGVDYYTCKSARWYKLGETIINRLTPYTEPDRKAIEDEVWEFARAMNDLSYDDFVSCFDGETEEFVYGLPYSTIKGKYNAWKKRKEEIHVGDEVEYGDTSGVVVRIDIALGHSGVNVVGRDGNTGYIGMAYVAKTGRHFSEVEKLLERMKAE